jgi:hypothetical protein
MLIHQACLYANDVSTPSNHVQAHKKRKEKRKRPLTGRCPTPLVSTPTNHLIKPVSARTKMHQSPFLIFVRKVSRSIHQLLQHRAQALSKLTACTLCLHLCRSASWHVYLCVYLCNHLYSSRHLIVFWHLRKAEQSVP